MSDELIDIAKRVASLVVDETAAIRAELDSLDIENHELVALSGLLKSKCDEKIDSLRAQLTASQAEVEQLREYIKGVGDIRAGLSREVEARIILDARKPLEAEVERLRGQRDKAKEIVSRLRVIIRKVEWSELAYTPRPSAVCCPLCHKSIAEGHTDDCPFYEWEGGAQ